MRMRRNQCLAALARRRRDEIVAATMSALGPWLVHSPSELNMSCYGFMGGASSLGLGLALARPERRVWVLDGDGSLLMQLGSLATIAGAAPPNLYHFVFQNDAYEISGGQPIPAAGRIDFAGMARAVGYAAAYRLTDLDEFESALDRILSQQGPVMAALEVDTGDEDPPGSQIEANPFPEHVRSLRRALLTQMAR
jgi:sulfopyruvate decarboxylase subunit beta